MPKTSFYSGTGITSEKADAVESSANSAAQSAADAATSEANALTSETNAASSAANALTSETNAAASETNALASATAAQNLEITSASFDTTDGTLTLTKANSGTVTADLDGRYITSETSHTDVLVDGDFTSEGLMKRDATSGSYSIVTDNSSDWDTAHGWGNHASAGYLTAHQDITGKANLSGATFTGDVRLSDDVELRLGDGVSGDLRIFHSSDSNSSTIREQGTGSLLIQGENLNVSDTSSKSYLSAIAGGSTKIYYDGSTKIETQTGGISVSGDIAVSGTVDGVDIAALNTTVSGKADLSGATFTGAITADGGFSTSTGHFATTTGNITSSYGSVIVGGSVTAPNVDISTTGSVTTNIATGVNNDNTTDVKVVNIGTGYGTAFFAGLSTTINMGSQSSNAKNIFNIGNGTTSGFGENTINLKGNVTVDGTVDGRDVSVDGAKLDTLERVYRTRFRNRYSEISTFQNLTNTIADIGNPIYTKSTTGSENTLDFFLATTCADYYDNNDGNIEVVVTAPNSSDEDVVNLGTVSNSVSNTPSGQYNFDVVGDVTKHLTDYCGLSINANGSNAFLYGQVRSNAYYNPSTNKTTISCNQYQSNKPVNGSTLYLHPFDWEGSGTAIIGNRIQIDEVVYNAQKMSRKDFSAYLGYFKSSVTVKIRGKEASATTDNIAIRKLEGTLTQVQD